MPQTADSLSVGPKVAIASSTAALVPERDATEQLLDHVEAPTSTASVTLTSGRTYELTAGDEADRLVIRARSGEVVLRIELTDQGPLLRFSGAEVALEATERVSIRGRTVEVHAEESLGLRSDGALVERVGGDRHARIDGEDRLEAASIAIQASEGALCAKAQGDIRLDGDRIGLNDAPLPSPFAWSALAEVDGDE